VGKGKKLRVGHGPELKGGEAAEHGRRQYEILELIEGKGIRGLLRRDKGLADKPVEMASENERSDPGRIPEGTPGIHAGI
jgi:hypothetical protein